MCGICGISNTDDTARPVDADLLRRMVSCLIHRGPDDAGTFIDAAGRTGLGHRRLSIIDLAGGKQPLASEDGAVHLVCNGEIYNFREIRSQLEERGHRFSTGSDNEVIIHLYEEHGADCVQHLRGMFAFALYDSHRRRLLLARDRLGQKPLFWTRCNGAIIFASTLPAILEHTGVPREIDPTALDQYLAYQYVPHPRTIFRGISKLPPGHILVQESGDVSISQYWQPSLQPDEGRSLDDWCDELRSLLTESVRLRLMSDVPLGAFLSGGIDSTVIVGIMASLMDRPVNTFSIGFTDPRYDERSYARLAAEKFGTQHREFVVEPQVKEILPKLVHHFGEPFADSSALPTFHLSEVTRRHVTVALTGDAGDELFLGYSRYKAVKLAGLIDRLPPLRAVLSSRAWGRLPASVEQKTIFRRLKRFVNELRHNPASRYFNWIAIFDDARRNELYEPSFAQSIEGYAGGFLTDLLDNANTNDQAAAAAYADLLSYLPGDLLPKVDVASMSVGLEARSPFLDHHLVEFAMRIPPRFKLAGFNGKAILKRAFRDMLPPSIRKRGKMGFGVPISSWFRNELAGYVREILLDPRCLTRGRFRPEAVRQLIDEHTSGVADHGTRLWSLLILELWEREFIDAR